MRHPSQEISMRAEISDEELARRLAAAMKILEDAAKAGRIRKRQPIAPERSGAVLRPR
jgi:hypothetical protein